jgi:DNA-binding CsgD family transcriptional regulator
MLYGRQAETAAVEGLIANARSSRSGVLVIRGEPGMGKSALLEYAKGRADGLRILTAVGAEAEHELAFAGLHSMLRPVLHHVEAIPEPYAAVLRGVFGLEPAQAVDRFQISIAVLSLLAEVAEEDPLLCLIDDAQWLDQASADALLFVARRLAAEGIVFLFSAREGGFGSFTAQGLSEITLDGLDTTAASALLASRARGPLSTEVCERLVRATGGNPLALHELASALSEEQLTGRIALPDPLPLGASLEDAYFARVRELPRESQSFLLLAATDADDEMATLLRAATILGLREDALKAAEASGLVRTDKGRLLFRHPLVRSAVYQMASFFDRQAAHRAFADALDNGHDDDRRAWHRAAATPAEDPAVADELERSADRARLRGGFAAAAMALERAAELSTNDRDRARRLVAAADSAWLGGRPSRAGDLLERAHPLASDERLRGELEHIRGTIELRCGVSADAFTILRGGATEIASVDPGRALQMLGDAVEAAIYAGDAHGVVEAAALAEPLPRSADQGECFAAAWMAGIACMLQGDAVRGASLLREVVELADEFDERLQWAGVAAYYLGDDAASHAFHTKAVAQARLAGALGVLPHHLEILAYDDVLGGRPKLAAIHASEGLRLAEETGQETAASRHHAVLAFTSALQGNEEDCRAHAASALEQAETRRLEMSAAYVTWALALLDLGLGRPDDALARLESLAQAPAGSIEAYIALGALPDLVESAVRANHLERAQTALATFEHWVQTAPRPWALALAARCRGLLSAGATADRHFAEALRLHGEAGRPFDRARTELVYGEYLRRTRRRKEARVHLRTALESLERLGGLSWADRARVELRATGETVRKRDVSLADELTPQELQIAQLVSGGATNREVAAQLFLSPRTIDYHLRKVFTKLGISSRVELIRLGVEGEVTPPVSAEPVSR